MEDYVKRVCYLKYLMREAEKRLLKKAFRNLI